MIALNSNYSRHGYYKTYNGSNIGQISNYSLDTVVLNPHTSAFKCLNDLILYYNIVTGRYRC